MHEKTVSNPKYFWEAFLNPGMIIRSQIHHHSDGIQVQESRMILGISPQILRIPLKTLQLK
ncbi:hypothetical protein B7C51_22725 [Paenibacillus larvae subsp. pulvifaciens]|uniref:Uncharacterized protein n=1 Tax=Paenibacillus larvae subsp. pulvifaciens TaxID=1477 RepID=A0A1V0UYQ2_9BACL|nr:hypothetical protein B7C51_22725 [Paenibacillus larvae subsp. pulvifaciens]